MTTITTIIPTIGRRSLNQTLASISRQVGPGDVVAVVHDAPDTREIETLVRQYGRYSEADWTYTNTGGLGHWGHAARNAILDQPITTDYVWTIDDDDIASPQAFRTFRQQTAAFTIYKMRFGSGHPAHGITCWREPRLRYGDIGTPMTLARPCNARFGLRYEGDWDYVSRLQEELGEPTFDSTIVAYIRPEEPHAD